MEAFCRSYDGPDVKDSCLDSVDVYRFGVVTLILFSGMNITTPRGSEIEYLVVEVSETQLTAIVMYINLGNLTKFHYRHKKRIDGEI